MEFEEYNIPEGESGVSGYYSYSPYELTRYEDIAFKALEPLLKQYPESFCYDPNSPVWDEFYKNLQSEIIKDHPDIFHFFHFVRHQHWKLVGINTYANKVLTTNRERRDWQYKIWGKQDRPIDMLATVLVESFPQLIENLDKTVSPCFFELKNFLAEVEAERHQLWETIPNELEKAFAVEKGDERAKYKYPDEFFPRVKEEINKRLSEKKYEEKECELINNYNSELEKWFCNLSLCDESGNPPEFLIDTAKKWIATSYEMRFINATTGETGWCSVTGTHNLPQYLNNPGKTPSFWAWPGTNSIVTFIYFKPENFEFKFLAWLPTVVPFPSEQTYEKALREAFENQLKEYLAKVSKEFQTHKLNTTASTATLELQIEWLVHKQAYKKSYRDIAEKYNSDKSTVETGIKKVASLLNIKLSKSR